MSPRLNLASDEYIKCRAEFNVAAIAEALEVLHPYPFDSQQRRPPVTKRAVCGSLNA